MSEGTCGPGGEEPLEPQGRVWGWLDLEWVKIGASWDWDGSYVIQDNKYSQSWGELELQIQI